MVIIRAVQMEDLERLYELAVLAGAGLTSLPKSKDLIRSRIQESVHNFSRSSDRPKGELYIFVLQDLESGLIVGTSCIVSKVGGFDPFYAYRVEKTVHRSEVLGISKQIERLNLVTEHSGPSEIGGLFLVPDYRKHGNGRLLSLFRFLYMADHSQSFEPTVIAEMRGVVDDRGHSPFWEAIGRHFFDMDYPKADLLSVSDKRFIAELMPQCPIYSVLLPKEAQAVIGKVHEETKPALKMLMDEGFQFSGLVDIFEAGPIIHCKLDSIRIVRESTLGSVADITSESVHSIHYIIATTSGGFRACVGNAQPLGMEGYRLHKSIAETLELRLGDKIRLGPLRPTVSMEASSGGKDFEKSSFPPAPRAKNK